MVSIEALTQAWNTLSQSEQHSLWRTFLNDLDQGEAAFHPYYLVLMPRWDCGDVPGEVQHLAEAEIEADYAAEAEWEATRLDRPGPWMIEGLSSAFDHWSRRSEGGVAPPFFAWLGA